MHLKKVSGRLKKNTPKSHLYVTLLGMKTHDPIELYELVRKGLSYRALERFQKNLALPTAQLAELLQIPLRTLSRRKEQGRLLPDESDRLLRVSRVVAGTLELFEADLEAARRWLLAPLRSLRGKSPLELATTEVGAHEVEDVIGRLEQAIIS